MLRNENMKGKYTIRICTILLILSFKNDSFSQNYTTVDANVSIFDFAYSKPDSSFHIYALEDKTKEQVAYQSVFQAKLTSATLNNNQLDLINNGFYRLLLDRDRYSIRYDLSINDMSKLQQISHKSVLFSLDSTYWFGRIPFTNTSLPIISNKNGNTDTISFAQHILDIGLVYVKPKWALYSGGIDDSRYKLAYKNKGTWEYHPILIKEVNSDYFPTWLFILPLFMGGIAINWLFWLNRHIDKKASDYVKGKTIEKLLNLDDDAPLDSIEKDKMDMIGVYEAVLEVKRNPNQPRPMTIVLNGQWGSGKSSIMKMIRNSIDNDPTNDGKYMTAWFNVWHQEDDTSLLNAFLLKVVECYNRNKKWFLDNSYYKVGF